MGITSLVGLLMGAGFVVYAIVSGGSISDFIDASSVMIVIGGTFGAMLFNYPIERFIGGVKSFMKVVTYKEINRKELLDKIVELAYASKKEGLLALETYAEEIKEAFFKKGILLVVDGTSPELTRTILELDISIKEDQDKWEQDFMNDAAKFAPAFGMIGTLIGLIKMLSNLSDSDSLGPSMSIALITTFYGALLANVVFTPLAGRLKYISKFESESKEMIVEGILAIQSGESPFTIKEKLNTYIFGKGKEKDEEKETD